MITARPLLSLSSALLAGCLLACGVASAQGARQATASSSESAALASDASHAMQEVVIHALALVGVSYRYGGDVPATGLDCSGLVRHVYRQVTGARLPRTAREQSRVGGNIAVPDLQPGDLVFFDTRRSPYSHVGIYLGENRFVHAPHTGGSVEIAELGRPYWRQRFNGARRLLDTVHASNPGNAFEVLPRPLPDDATFIIDMTGA